jgi:predicted DNA-binding transcriptional regulator AlpA
MTDKEKAVDEFKKACEELHKPIETLVGVKEASYMLGWSKQQVMVYISRGKFPEPIQRLASGPIWTKKQIEEFIKERMMKMNFTKKELIELDNGGFVLDSNEEMSVEYELKNGELFFRSCGKDSSCFWSDWQECRGKIQLNRTKEEEEEYQKYLLEYHSK